MIEWKYFSQAHKLKSFYFPCSSMKLTIVIDFIFLCLGSGIWWFICVIFISLVDMSLLSSRHVVLLIILFIEY